MGGLTWGTVNRIHGKSRVYCVKCFTKRIILYNLLYNILYNILYNDIVNYIVFDKEI